MWVFSWIKLSWHSCSVCETNLDGSIDSGNFFLTGCLPLIQKDSFTHIHGLAAYMKEGLSFARDLSLGNSVGSYLCFLLAYIHHKDWLTYSWRTGGSGELCYNFSISNDLTQMVNFLDFFLCSNASICSEILPFSHVVVSVWIDFLSDSKWDAFFHHIP